MFELCKDGAEHTRKHNQQTQEKHEVKRYPGVPTTICSTTLCFWFFLSVAGTQVKTFSCVYLKAEALSNKGNTASKTQERDSLSQFPDDIGNLDRKLARRANAQSLGCLLGGIRHHQHG